MSNFYHTFCVFLLLYKHLLCVFFGWLELPLYKRIWLFYWLSFELLNFLKISLKIFPFLFDSWNWLKKSRKICDTFSTLFIFEGDLFNFFLTIKYHNKYEQRTLFYFKQTTVRCLCLFICPLISKRIASWEDVQMHCIWIF